MWNEPTYLQSHVHLLFAIELFDYLLLVGQLFEGVGDRRLAHLTVEASENVLSAMRSIGLDQVFKHELLVVAHLILRLLKAPKIRI